MQQKLLCSILLFCVSLNLLCADLGSHQLYTININPYYSESWVRSILFHHGLNPETDFPKPMHLAQIEKAKWERAIPFIVAGALLVPFPPTRKLGIMLISMGLEYLGWEYYNHIWDYLEERGISIDRTLLEKPEN